MGFRDRWRFTAKVAEERMNSEPQEKFAIGEDDIVPELFGLSRYETLLGPVGRISRQQAIQVPSVKRARDLICGTIAGLPLYVLDPENKRGSLPLLEQPEIGRTRRATIADTVEDMLFEKVAWWRIVMSSFDNYPYRVEYVPVGRVQENDGKVYIDGKYVPDDKLIRFDGPNEPLLVAGARAIRTLLKLDVAAGRYADEPQMQGYFTPAEGADPDDDNGVEEMLEKFKLARQARVTGYVPASLKYNEIQGWSPEQLQLVEARQHANLEVARLTNIDPGDLGVPITTRTYQNESQRRMAFQDFTLGGFIDEIQQRLSMADVTKRGYRVRFDTTFFTRSDEASRMETYQKAVDLGAYGIDEVQRREELPSFKKPKPEPATPPAQPQEQIVQNSAPVSVSFSAETTSFRWESDTTDFAASTEKRTVSGTLIPYGPVGSNGQGRWRFAPGSVEWNRSAVSRVKLNREHDRGQLLGAATELKATESGVFSRFKVGRSAQGDEALSLAEDGILDGLSGELDILDYTTDPVDPSVFLVTKARLKYAALTATPAFDDARLTSVAASAHTEGNTAMPCSTCGQVHAPGTPCATPAAPTADFSAVTDAIREGFANLGQGGREVVPAARGGARLQVAEPVPYRFNGLRGQYDFSTDLIGSLRNRDGEAGNRIDQFMAQTFAIAQADVNELNPARYRPDLYVDNLDFTTPVWDAINKGTLTDSTPFTLSKHNTSSGLVGDHTEGQAPNAGAFTTTGQTITPTATSGRAEITRETWDQGGNPQLSTILWRQIMRDYYEALEVGAVAMLDALAPTAIALNGVDADLDADVTANLTALAYIRGGNRFRDFFVASNLFTALAGAVDDNGRKLFPVLAPSNASGTTDSFFGELSVGGLRAKPAWALEAGNGGDGSSYLFDREDVHGWATAPRQFTFEYRVEFVDIAVWGYKAFANTRLAGVREVTYSAV